MTALDLEKQAISLELSAETAAVSPTIWGLDQVQLHDYYWAARGVQVVRVGDRSALVEGPELYLLTDHDTFVLARVRSLVDLLSWVKPVVLIVRMHEKRSIGYREHAITDENGCLVRFERSYGSHQTITRRIAFTRDPDIARAWQ